jgi:hypothetical protein
MRQILRKLDKRQSLTPEEYELLQSYIDTLSEVSFDSYEVFYARYASILWNEYSLYIPHFKYDIDDFINYLSYHPDTISKIKNGNNPQDLFPTELQPYLNSLLKNDSLTGLLQLLANNTEGEEAPGYGTLPRARTGNIVFKYEEDNPYKEIGLKSHFHRLSKYQFITRLQSYRYLTRNKAKVDSIYVLTGDKLGGIFTNKYKSIYYYIFLSEHNPAKAETAARILNLAFYGKS